MLKLSLRLYSIGGRLKDNVKFSYYYCGPQCLIIFHCRTFFLDTVTPDRKQVDCCEIILGILIISLCLLDVLTQPLTYYRELRVKLISEYSLAAILYFFHVNLRFPNSLANRLTNKQTG